ncbi:hypothetical protein FBY41_0712 [Humibacillus xanthopallidus]|uniref:Uncharacterized protein n=1 Tax=Humibacillus xanthopallidus TaxID=412689 RepID=A0A543I166_9MICO|nr:hypothetical protein FBY41_0712 [Humibacillus xanthopallidus]
MAETADSVTAHAILAVDRTGSWSNMMPFPLMCASSDEAGDLTADTATESSAVSA